MKRLYTIIVIILVFLTSCAKDGREVFGEAIHIEGPCDNGYSGGIDLERNILFVGSGDNLCAYDVSSPLEPELLGVLPGFDSVRQLVVRNGFVYVVSRETGMRVVDARDPKAMRIRSRFDSVEFATGIEVVGNTAFISERINGVEVVDVSDPDLPVHVCIRKTRESQSSIYRNGYLYSGEWATGEVSVFDARDLGDFRQIDTLQLGGFGDGVTIDGKYLYASTGHDARHHRVETCDGQLSGAGHGLDIFCLDNPAKPRHIGRVDFPIFEPRTRDYWTPRVSNGIAFCCDSHNGLFAVDVKNPRKAYIADEFLLDCNLSIGQRSACPSSLAIGDGCIYVIFNPGGLYVIPARGVKPVKQDKGKAPSGTGYREKYVTDTSAFHVYRPAAAGQARTVQLRGDYVYAAFGDAGLHVLKITDDGFVKAGELPGNHRVTDCCFIGDRLLTAEGLDGFALYELDGSANCKEVGRRPLFSGNVAFWCWALDSHRALLSGRSTDYFVIDVDNFNASQPLAQFRGNCQWDKYPADRALNGHLPVLDAFKGMFWIDLTKDDVSVNKISLSEDSRNICGAQVNGLCALDCGSYLFTIKNPEIDQYNYKSQACYTLVSSDGHIGEVMTLPGFTGIPRTDGRYVLITNRSERKAAVLDFVDPENPVLLRTYTLSSQPDYGVLYQGHAIIPAGHQGVIMEK